jgi:hypothetical protein
VEREREKCKNGVLRVDKRAVSTMFLLHASTTSQHIFFFSPSLRIHQTHVSVSGVMYAHSGGPLDEWECVHTTRFTCTSRTNRTLAMQKSSVSILPTLFLSENDKLTMLSDVVQKICAWYGDGQMSEWKQRTVARPDASTFL